MRKIKKLITISGMLLLLITMVACNHNLVKGYEIPLTYCNVTVPKTDSFEIIVPTKRSVKIDSFLMCSHEVTQGEWQWVMGNVDRYIKTAWYGKGDKYPMYLISWLDAVSFCNVLSKKHNLTPCYTINGNSVSCDFSANGYRLPTAAEWEYASCASYPGDLPYSGAKTKSESNHSGSVWYEPNSGHISHEVATKSPNDFGLYDMSGNVWEWCWDWFDKNYTETDNPRGADSGTKKILRGGGFKCPAYSVRARACTFKNTDDKWNLLGFRVCRTDK